MSFYETLQKDCCRLLIKQPFVAHVLLSLELNVDNGIPTAATDGFNIWINENFYLGLTPDERIFVLAHETWHVILLHFTRRGARDANLFNVAADLEIHFALERDHFKEPFVLDHMYSWNTLSAEEIYEELLKKIQREERQKAESSQKGNVGVPSGGGGCPPNPAADKGGSEGDGKPGAVAGDEEAGSDGGEKPGAVAGDEEADREGGEKTGAAATDEPGSLWPTDGRRGFDQHKWESGTVQGREFADKLRTILSRSIARAGGTHLPDFLVRHIKSFITPRVDWKILLKQYVSQSFGGGRRWLPPARRYLAQKLYLPSRRSEKLDNVVVALDTSGSMEWNLPLIFGELVSLLKSFDRYDLHVLQFDTEVRKVDSFSDTRPFDVNALDVWGGGGTEINSVFEYIKNSKSRPTLLMILTDGYNATPIQPRPPACPVLWLLPEDSNENVAPWGRKIFVGEDGILSRSRMGRRPFGTRR